MMWCSTCKRTLSGPARRCPHANCDGTSLVQWSEFPDRSQPVLASRHFLQAPAVEPEPEPEPVVVEEEPDVVP